MNLIEKVASLVTNYVMGDHKTGYEFKAAKDIISAMPSIKWHKIETLPDSFKTTRGKEALFWLKDVGCYRLYWSENYACLVDDEYMRYGIADDEITHWAEINAPEEE